MKRSTALPALLGLAVGLATLAGAPRPVGAGDDPVQRPPDLIGRWRGTYQNELNRSDRGPVVVEISAQVLGRLTGRMLVRGREYRIEGTVTPDGEVTLAGSDPTADLSGPQWLVHGCIDLLVAQPRRRRTRARFMGEGIADLGRCCSRPVTLILYRYGGGRVLVTHTRSAQPTLRSVTLTATSRTR